MQVLEQQQQQLPSVILHGLSWTPPSSSSDMNLTADGLSAMVSAISADSFKDEIERSRARKIAQGLVDRIETPWEATFNTVWAQPALSAAVKTCVDLKLFEKWRAADQDNMKPKTLDELTRLCDCDSQLLLRLLNHLLAMNVLAAEPNGAYVMTKLSAALGDPSTGIPSCFSYLFSCNYPGFGNLPAFLKSEKFRNPSDPEHCNWQAALPESASFFEYLSSDPQRVDDFQNTMQAYGSSKIPWTSIYPTHELVKSATADRPIVVDVGGGHGQDMSRMLAAHPDLPSGSLVLQDLPDVVGPLKLDSKITIQAHDFFTPQPVKGARAYYMHIVAHDWPDVQCKPLFEHLAAAMTRDYSVLLIHEAVIDTHAPHRITTSSDLTMMMVFSARERTKEMWQTLIESAGLKVQRIFSGDGTESIIEAVLA